MFFLSWLVATNKNLKISEPVTSIVTVMYSRRGEVGSIWIWERFHVHILIVFGVICNVFRLMYGVQNFLAVWSKRHQVKGRRKRKIYWLFISVNGVLTAKEYLCVVIKYSFWKNAGMGVFVCSASTIFVIPKHPPTLQSIWTIRAFLIDAVLSGRPSGSISLHCCCYVVLYTEKLFDITRDLAFELRVRWDSSNTILVLEILVDVSCLPLKSICPWTATFWHG